MGWTLRVKNPLGTITKATFTDVVPGGIGDGFEWTCKANTDCVSMTFKGEAKLLTLIASDDVVEWEGVNVPYFPGGTVSDRFFVGKVKERPHPEDQDKGTFTVVGLADWLKNGRVQTARSGFDTVPNIVQNALGPQLPTYISSQGYGQVQAGLGSRSFDLGTTQMGFALDNLAASSVVAAGTPPVEWGVNRYGELIFKQPTDNVNLNYTPNMFDPRGVKISSDNLVTAVTLSLGWSDPSDGRGEEYIKPHEITYRVTHADHATYESEIYRQVNNAIVEIQPTQLGFWRGGLNFTNLQLVGETDSYGPQTLRSTFANGLYAIAATPAELADASDDSLTTFWNLPVTVGGVGPYEDVIFTDPNNGRYKIFVQAYAPAGYRIIGARWDMDAPGSNNGNFENVRLMIKPITINAVDQTGVRYAKSQQLSSRVAGRYSGSAVLWGKDSNLANETQAEFWITTAQTDSPNPGGNDVPVRIHTLKLIAVKLDVLEATARSLLNPPKAVIEKIKLDGYLYPFAQVTVFDTPSGTVTGDAKEYRYSYTSKDGWKTEISLGASGTPEFARVMKLMASDLDNQSAARSVRNAGRR